MSGNFKIIKTLEDRFDSMGLGDTRDDFICKYELLKIEYEKLIESKINLNLELCEKVKGLKEELSMIHDEYVWEQEVKNALKNNLAKNKELIKIFLKESKLYVRSDGYSEYITPVEIYRLLAEEVK